MNKIEFSCIDEETEARWCVEEEATGMPVANGSAPTTEEASREAAHYALHYAQDGPVRWWVRQNRKTVFQGRLAGVSITVLPASENHFASVSKMVGGMK
ncbi:MAG: hypothetical protein ING36_00210 [Burkholderiales bacterium]|jgi:hypothetical protein|nr:hypothetical protein [Burkholderiales bacterium]MCA3173951.1 hypothetical protein [Burkholderiales bacterium]